MMKEDRETARTSQKKIRYVLESNNAQDSHA